MRIIAGIRKGLKLKAPDGMGTRPTTDRVKESLFNIIQRYLPTESVLDLFAGSAALGIEALSRRCEKCVFVEHNRGAYALAEQNISAAGFEDRARLVRGDSLEFIKGISGEKSGFDIIFLDPPYNTGFIYPVLDTISRNRLLRDGGIITVETEKDGEAAEHPDFEVVRRAAYGKTVITVLTRGEGK